MSHLKLLILLTLSSLILKSFCEVSKPKTREIIETTLQFKSFECSFDKTSKIVANYSCKMQRVKNIGTTLNFYFFTLQELNKIFVSCSKQFFKSSLIFLLDSFSIFLQPQWKFRGSFSSAPV